MKAITPGKAIRYICKCDRTEGIDNQVVFLIKYLDPIELARIKDDVYNARGIGDARTEKFTTGTSELEAMRRGLAGWENFKDENGEDVIFSANVDENIGRIPPTQRSEIANMIQGIES